MDLDGKTIKSGQISVNGTGISVTIKNGNIVNNGNASAIYIGNNATVTSAILEDLTVTSASTQYPLAVGLCDSCEVIDTKLYQNYGYTWDVFIDSTNTGTVTFSGNSGIYGTNGKYAISNQGNGAVYITGNTEVNTTNTSLFATYNNATISITSGYFTVDPSSYLAEGSSVAESSDNSTYAYQVVSASTGETEPDTTIDDADELIAAVEAGGKYTLGDNIDMGSSYLTVLKDFELDLATYTLDFSGSDSGDSAINVGDNNGSVSPTLKIYNGKIAVNTNRWLGAVVLYNNTKFDFNSITFDYARAGGTVVNATGTGITGAMTKCTTNTAAVRSITTGNSITVSDCTITQTGTGGYYYSGIVVCNGGALTVENTDCDADSYAAYVYSSGGTINIDGGTWSGDIAVLKADAGTIDVSAGTFTGAISIASGADLNISGGTFNNTGITDIDTFSAYVADGYEATCTGDDSYTVAVAADAAVASVTVDDVTTKYETLEKAFDAVSGTATHTITLLDDVEITSVISIQSGETAIFDMEGFTITYQQSGARPINNAGTLTINGENGTVTLAQLPMLLCVASF